MPVVAHEIVDLPDRVDCESFGLNLRGRDLEGPISLRHRGLVSYDCQYRRQLTERSPTADFLFYHCAHQCLLSKVTTEQTHWVITSTSETIAFVLRILIVSPSGLASMSFGDEIRRQCWTYESKSVATWPSKGSQRCLAGSVVNR